LLGRRIHIAVLFLFECNSERVITRFQIARDMKANLVREMAFGGSLDQSVLGIRSNTGITTATMDKSNHFLFFSLSARYTRSEEIGSSLIRTPTAS
jgi:hypothetical protein